MTTLLSRLLLLAAWGTTLCLSSHFSFPRQLFDNDENNSNNNCPGKCRCDNKNVYCSGHNLTAFPAGIPVKARALFMDSNEVTVLNFQTYTYLRKLTYLSLMRNKIRTIPAKQSWRHLSNLEVLNLDYNLIETLDLSVFSDLNELKTLSLTFNKIHTISFSSSEHNYPLQKLKNLYLAENEFTTFDILILSPLKNLKQVSLKGKGQTCSCDWRGKLSGGKTVDLTGLQCGQVSRLPGKAKHNCTETNDSVSKGGTDSFTKPPTDAPTKPVTDAPTKPVTYAPTLPVTEAPTKPVTDAPTKPVTDAPTLPVTEAPTKPVTDAPTKPVTDAATKPDTDAPTLPVIEAPTKPVTDAPTKPVTDAPTKPVTDVPILPVTDSPTKPVTDGPTKSVTNSPTKPVTDSPSKPVTDSPTKPVTDSPTNPVTESPTKPVTNSPTKPVTDAPTLPVTEAPTKPVTDAPTKAVTDAPTLPVTDSPTKLVTDVPTKLVTDGPTKPVTDSPTKSVTDSPTNPVTESPTKPVTNSPTKPVTDSPTKPDTEAPTKSVTEAPTKPIPDTSTTSPSVANTDSLLTASLPLETMASSPSKGSADPTGSVTTGPGVTDDDDSSESDEAINCYVCRNVTDKEQCTEQGQCVGRKSACMSSIQLTGDRMFYTKDCAERNSCSNRCTCAKNSCRICCKEELCNNDDDASTCVCKGELKAGLTWPITLYGSTAELPCPDPSTGKVTRQCLSTWKDPNFSECLNSSKITNDLEDLLDEDISENTMTVSKRIMELAARSSEFNERDVENAVKIVTELLRLSMDGQNRDVIKNTVSAMSHMFQIPKRSLVGAERKFQSAKRYLKTIDDFAGHVKLKDSPIEEVHPNLAIVVKQIDHSDFNNITLEADREMVGKASILFRDAPSTVSDGVVYKDSVRLPATLFSGVENSALAGGNRASFILHQNDTFFKAIQDAQEQSRMVGDGSVTVDHRNLTQVNSRVVSVTIGNLTLTDLQDPVLITFRHRVQNSTNPRCVFWDVVTETWSSRGCRMTEYISGSHTICQCDHLTNFALLMDVYDSGTAESPPHADVLTLLSLIGCAISFFGLVLTIIIYCLFSKLRRDTPSKILLNLCLALACVNVTFIIGIYALENPALCKAIAILMHYFLLSSMAWMSIEAFYMYLALVLVFRTYFRRFLLKTMLFGWGLPLLIVSVTIGVNQTGNYGSLANDKLCWLNRTAFYVTFLAPVAIVLIGNSIIFTLVIRQICGMSSKKLNKSEQATLTQQLRGVAGVFILLGLTWLFAIFAIGDASLVFQYLFTIFNSLQGLFIFIFYCLMKRDIQKRLFCCNSHTFPSFTSQKSSRGTNSTTHVTKGRFRAAVNAVMSTRLASKRGSKETIQEKLEDINATPLGPLEVRPSSKEREGSSPPPYDSLNVLY